MGKPRVIVVTDGDRVAQGAVEQAARNIGGCTVSLSAGSPTPLSGEEIVELVKRAQRDPVLVMVDDRGSRRKGAGEAALEHLAGSDEIELLGVIAVASNTEKVMGVPVTHSVAADGRVIEGPVDKEGLPEPKSHERVEGDTVDVLNQLDVPVVVGLGDPGKMNRADKASKGAVVTTKAVKTVLELSQGQVPDAGGSGTP
ncbi:MAG TPA: stage V sporulation protein AE [Firmicutes bacterium]|nr:stage V sporulation protein AE [Bacillota bacterium]